MRRDDLNQLFGPPPVIRRSGRIETVLGLGWYYMRDGCGRFHLVEGDKDWGVGETVTSIGGRIVGRAAAASKIKVFHL